MKRTLLLALLLTSLPLFASPLGIYQHGTVIRMRMGDCTLTHRGFVTNFGTPQGQLPAETCPEYTLLTDKVVYVMVGKNSNQLVPLAEVIDFRIQKNQLAVRVDDARHESKFAIKEMILRSQWDLLQRHIEEQLREQGSGPVNSALTLKTRE